MSGFTDDDILKLEFEIKEIDIKKYRSSHFNRRNEDRSYGLLIDILYARMDFYAKHVPTYKISNPTHAQNLITRHNLLVKLENVFFQHFEEWNEVYNCESKDSWKSIIKNAKITIKWGVDLTDKQYDFFSSLTQCGPIKLRTTYTYNYMPVLPPKESDLKKLRKIEKEHFKRTL